MYIPFENRNLSQALIYGTYADTHGSDEKFPILFSVGGAYDTDIKGLDCMNFYERMILLYVDESNKTLQLLQRLHAPSYTTL